VSDVLQLVFDGLSQGAVYAVIAVGFVAIFSVSGVINIAQGDFAAVGALLTTSLIAGGLPLLAAAPVAVAALGVGAMVMQRVAIAPVRRMTALTSILLTLGLSICIEATAVIIWGSEGRSLPPVVAGTTYLGGVAVSHQKVVLVLVALAVVAAVAWFYGSTTTGRAMRACAEQPVAARLVGISATRMAMIAFLIAGATAAVAGILLSPLATTEWDSGLFLGLKGFVAATLAGLVSVRGALVGGLVLGVIEQLCAFYIGSGYSEAAAFLVLMVVLVVRPGGIVGHGAAVRV